MADFFSSQLSDTVAHAVAYLVRPLAHSYSLATVTKLQHALEANLMALFSSTRLSKDSLRGSSRPHRLTLSPHRLPSDAIYSACLASGVQWFDWMALLGGREFDLLLGPGRVAMQFKDKAADSKLYTIWSEDHGFTSVSAGAPVDSRGRHRVHLEPSARPSTKTFAQQILELDDSEDETLFALIADQVTDPLWTPTNDRFPIVPPRAPSPFSTASVHSRSSSCSSDSSAGFSSETTDSFSSFESSSSPVMHRSMPVQQKTSRRERTKQPRVFVDMSKNQVTPYDGGKTTVLTGGVMLGAKSAPVAAHKRCSSLTVPPALWRSQCA
jgi:hypothetical protein